MTIGSIDFDCELIAFGNPLNYTKGALVTILCLDNKIRKFVIGLSSFLQTRIHNIKTIYQKDLEKFYRKAIEHLANLNEVATIDYLLINNRSYSYPSFSKTHEICYDFRAGRIENNVYDMVYYFEYPSLLLMDPGFGEMLYNECSEC